MISTQLWVAAAIQGDDPASRLARVGAFLRMLWADLTAALADSRVWLSFAVVLTMGTACLIAGAWMARRVGLLARGALFGETLGVGLSVGLLVLAASWAAVFSGGRSSFTPVAVALGIGVVVAGWRRKETLSADMPSQALPRPEKTPASRRSLPLGPTAAVAFVVLVGLLYGVAISPSPRDGVQPVEFMDGAYYSVLGADLARTGTESIYSPSGFVELPDLPVQTWYHWGEMWISASVITITGLDPMLARHYVVLPLVLLAAAALTGTLVRRLTRTDSTGAFIFGAAASLFLAPLPMPGPPFSSWATGLIFAVTLYGLGAVCALLALYVVTIHDARPSGWGFSIFCGALAASLLPSHIVLAILALVGAVGVVTLESARSIRVRRRIPKLSHERGRTLAVGVVISALTVSWGLWTGHGIGTSGLSPSVAPFNDSWRATLVLLGLGAGTFLTIPIAWAISGGRPLTAPARLFAGTTVLLAFGAVAWGARLGDFTMFHVLFGGLVVFGTPAAAVAARLLWLRLREGGHLRIAAAGLLACALQLEIGVAAGVSQLYEFGANDYDPIPESLLASIAALEPDSRLVYACGGQQEVAFWDPRLASINAHTGRPIIPMCFQAEFFGRFNGGELSPQTPSPLFTFAPQRALYPQLNARPSPADVAAFMREHGIEYIYVDRIHPNTLVPNAIPVAVRGEFQILRLP